MALKFDIDGFNHEFLSPREAITFLKNMDFGVPITNLAYKMAVRKRVKIAFGKDKKMAVMNDSQFLIDANKYGVIDNLKM